MGRQRWKKQCLRCDGVRRATAAPPCSCLHALVSRPVLLVPSWSPRSGFPGIVRSGSARCVSRQFVGWGQPLIILVHWRYTVSATNVLALLVLCAASTAAEP